MRKPFPIVIIIVLGLVIHAHFNQEKERETASLEQESAATNAANLLPERADEMPREPRAAITYSCDGRTRCTQMRSCEEATWFIENCPGMEMDGDHDGVPCESQWCGH